MLATLDPANVLAVLTSNAPMSAAAPEGRGCPSKSASEALAVLPLSIAGELLCRWKLKPNSSTNLGSAVIEADPHPLPLPVLYWASVHLESPQLIAAAVAGTSNKLLFSLMVLGSATKSLRG